MTGTRDGGAPLRGIRPGWVLLGAVTLTPLAFLTSPGVFEGLDWLQMHLPYRVHAAQSLRAGELPLWNPYVALGRPFLGDLETAVFYAPNLLFLVLDPALALAAVLTLHVALALAATMALARALGATGWASALAAAAFVLGAPVASRLVSGGQIGYFEGTCYLPLVVLLAMRLQDAPSPRRMALLALALAGQLLCGHPQIAWLTWLGAAAFVASRGTRAWRGLAADMARFGAALALGFGLTAPALMPFAELATQGNRSASPALATGSAMQPWHWLSLLVDDAGRHLFYWESNLHLGALVALGGAAGLAWLRGRERRGLLAMALVGLLVAAGSSTPLFRVLHLILPGAGLFRIHSRGGILVCFALLLAAAIFVSRRLPGKTALLWLGLSAGAVVAARVIALLASDAREHRLVLTVGVVLALAVAASAALVVSGPARLVSPAVAALCLASATELALAHGVSRRTWAWPQPPYVRSEAALAARLAGVPAEPGGTPVRVLVPFTVARENAALLGHWSGVTGYGSLTLARVASYLSVRAGLPEPVEGSTYVPEEVFSRGPFPYTEAAIRAGWDAAGGRLVVRADPDPRVFVVSRTRQVDGWQRAIAAMAAGHDVHETTLLEAGPPRAPASHLPQPAGTARIMAFARERISVRVDAAHPSLLVVKEAWYPGWTAEVDGVQTLCLPANGWMRAVPVEAGEHIVTLRFGSRFLVAGMLVALVAAALCLAALISPLASRDGLPPNAARDAR